MSDRERQIRENRICQNSIERMINTTLRLLHSGTWKSEADRELLDINIQDWEELKVLTVTLWNEERNRIFTAKSKT